MTYLVGDLKSVVVGSEADVGLLLAVGPDEGVDLGSLNVVELLNRVLDVALVGTEVNNENKGVVVLNLLHGRLGADGELDSAELVHAGKVRDRLAGVLGGASKTKGLGAVEGGRGADLLRRVRLGALEGSLLSRAGLGLLGLAACNSQYQFHQRKNVEV